MSYTVKITEGDKTVYEYTGNIAIIGQAIPLEDENKSGALSGIFVDGCEAEELVAVYLALERDKKQMFEKHPSLGKLYTEMLVKEFVLGGAEVEQYDFSKLMKLANERGIGT